MNTIPASTSLRTLLSILVAVAAFATLSVRARAEDLDTISIDGPVVKTIGRDTDTLAPIEEVSVSAIVATDSSTLRTDSGVALFKDNVREAARKACEAADPLRPDDGTCVRNALAAAKPQVDAAIADARSRANG